MQEAHEGAKAALVDYLEKIHGQMQVLVSNHMEACDKLESTKTEWKDKSVLRLGIYKSGNHLQVKWFTIKWFGKGAARRSVKGVIRKSSKEDTYSLAQLKEMAKEWEWPIVEKTELQLGMLRRQASFVVKSITALRYAKMAMDKFDAAFPSQPEIPD